ncbi:hypothetical protein D4S03_11520 [bacterium]|nr:MAG: hypothetical protein D4S03_11520 [bacterium]
MTRRRHPSRANWTPIVTSYPPPGERLRLIARRDELTKALIKFYVRGKGPGESRVKKLMAEYGAKEVLHIYSVLQRQFQRNVFLIDEPEVYRHYRLGFARFGGTRLFLPKAGHEELNYERALLFSRREFHSRLPLKPSPRKEELRDLLLMDWPFWEDITPPDIPPPPVDYPPPASYPQPLSALLTWGWNLDLARISRECAAWQASQSNLERMVLDETLLNGWPGESASWAPWHALHLLGKLNASGCARRLVDLYNRPNDWLSDCLPQVWAQMGPAVETSLWNILDDPACKPDQRGLAAAGLQKLIQNQGIPRLPAIHALAERLQPGRTDNAIVNAYVVFVLNRLKAVEVKDAIRASFENGQVDTKTMDPRDVSFLED